MSYNNKYIKRVNVKKFFTKITEYELIKKFFEMNNLTNIPFISDMKGSSSSEELYAFYLSLEGDDQINVREELEKINFLSNFDANDICKSLSPKNLQGETVLSAYSIMAESYTDKALAFYIDNFEKVEDAINIYTFYKISGWKRYEAGGDVNIDFKNEEKKVVFEKINDDIKTKFEEMCEVALGYIPTKINVETKEYDQKYFTSIYFTDGTEKNISFVYIKDLKEVMIKNGGSKLDTFSLAEMYMKKLTGFAMDMKEANYNLLNFIDINYKDKIKDDEKLKELLSQDILKDQNVLDWSVTALSLSRNSSSVNLKFKKSDELKYMSPFYVLTSDMNIDTKIYKLESVSLVLTIKINRVKTIKKKMSLTIKEKSCNLNLLKEEHITFYKILKDKNIFEGYKAAEM